MSDLFQKLTELAEEIGTTEAAIVRDKQVLAYTRVDIEGDSHNLIVSNLSNQADVTELQSAQLLLGQSYRSAVISVSTTLIKALF